MREAECVLERTHAAAIESARPGRLLRRDALVTVAPPIGSGVVMRDDEAFGRLLAITENVALAAFRHRVEE